MLSSILDESTELILGEDRYNRWCQADHLRELYAVLRTKVVDVTFYITGHKDHDRKLPKAKFKRKVAIYAGDETGRKIPPFIDQVDLIFRECNHAGKIHDKIYPKPMGYNTRHAESDNNQYPFSGKNKPWKERENKIFFSGQVHVQDRRDMVVAISKMDRKRWDIHLTDRFAMGFSIPKYYERMSNAKIVLCPKGGAPESFRYTEAMKCGSSVISTFKPEHGLWYYDKSPAVILEKWEDLSDELVERMILQPKFNRMMSTTYYTKYLSEEAQANYITDVLESL